MEFCDAPTCMRSMGKDQKEREVEGRLRISFLDIKNDGGLKYHVRIMGQVR